jgi:iron complex transport system substrate-binding protein
MEEFVSKILRVAVLAGVVTLAACGSDAKPSADATTPRPSATTAAPSTSATPATTTPAQAVPQRIISLSPTGTEMLYAIGAGDEVLAVDDQSNYPPEVLQKPHDLSGYQPNVEAIAALKPDLVVIGDDSSSISKQLESIGLHTWVGEAAKSFDDVYDQIQQLGTITGHTSDATELVTHMRTDIQAAVAAAPKGSTALTYYHEIDNTYYSITENTFIGQVYSLFGLRSIADMQEVSSDYPQLSAEAIISANPDFIFLADGNFGESPQTVAARPGWSDLKAVQHDNVIVVDPDLSSRWGPRIVQFIQMVSAAVTKAMAAA